MNQQSMRLELLMVLTKHYEEDSSQFVTIPPPLMEMSLTRSALAELRNDRYVEEQARGVIRLRPRGYMMCQKEIRSPRPSRK